MTRIASFDSTEIEVSEDVMLKMKEEECYSEWSVLLTLEYAVEKRAYICW